MSYKHGLYGELSGSKATNAAKAGSVAVYIGTAPINQISSYGEKALVNMPIKIENMSDAKSTLGYSDDWGKFTLCEAIAAHFNNPVGNVGPIYVINVLDPATHKAAEKVTTQLTVSGTAEIKGGDIILDTVALSDMVEGTDYTISYDANKEAVVIKFADSVDAETVSCTYEKIDASKITEADIIGGTTEDGQYTGLDAAKMLYQNHNVVLNMLAAPGWSHIPAVYKAMLNTVQKLNGHWDGFVNADIPLEDEKGNEINTIAKAIEWKNANGYTSEFSKVYWPMVKDGSGRVFHLSTAGQATMLRVDLSHDGVPFESPSNKEIMATSQYFGEDSKSRGFDQQTANGLNEKGITTACFWAGQWVLWGPHTAAYTYNGSMDARAIFDVNLRMLMHITNSFQLDHGTEIDSPMTPQDKDTILNFERQKLDTLCGIGTLIGTPSVEFLETENSVTDMMNGDFVWNFNVTNTPPFKSGTARVCYTDEGFAAFFETE